MKNIDFPPDFENGNIVQIYIHNEPWLKGDKYTSQKRHSQLLEEILNAHNISDFEKTTVSGVVFPVLVDPKGRYRVAGMGTCQVFRNMYSIGGWCEDWGGQVDIDKQHLEDLGKINPELDFIC